MRLLGLIRGKVSGEVFDYQVLLDALSGYAKPRDKITRLLADGAIVRIKKGLYCFGKAFRRALLGWRVSFDCRCCGWALLGTPAILEC